MNAPRGEETIFAEALRLPPEERAAFISRATRDNPALREEVESLLRSYATGDFLERAAASELRPTIHLTVPVTEKPGDTIGRYKLLQQIGEGGCGVVYMAEQSESVRRRVALKIIKLGMDTKSVIARFEAERQALAMMDHPNIAKVFDAGTTETGRPYFVMELVRGMKITEFCDEKKLSTKQRLDLFIQVCQAIQHAHQKGIIHRDIKPSNILVSVNDGVTVPKVIDFGIAKATSGQQLTDKTVFTAFEQFIGTPAYMSPEQAMITNVDIDTRSDIYALGVLLYELLTGRTPFDTQDLLAVGLDEMRRTIREREPQRPSTRLSTLPGQELSTAARRRGLDAPKLVSELRGDLDWIVMKAMEKDRARRYETANGLATDIQRHLNNEPVAACPPSRLYRLQKIVRRNKMAFAAMGAVLVSLAVGLTFATVSFFREQAARQRADEQTTIARAVNEFLQEDLLRQASSYSQADAHFTPDPDLTVREALDRAAERIGERFKDHALQEAAVRMAIGEALLGVGETERAITNLQRALELRRKKLGSSHSDTLTSMHHVANAYRVLGKFDQALPLLEETFRLRQATLAPDHPDTLTSMGFLGILYLDAGKTREALPLLEETLKVRTSKLGSHDPATIRTMGALASAYRRDGKLHRALRLQEEALNLQTVARGPDHPETLLSMNNLAGFYLDALEIDRALLLARQVLELRKSTQGLDNPETLRSMFSLATTYSVAGQLDEALSLLERTLELQRAKLPADHPDTLNTMNNLGIVYARMGKPDKAVPLLEDTLRLSRSKAGWDPQHARFTRHNLENAYRLTGNLDQLESMYRERLSQPGSEGLKAKLQVATVLLEKASKTNNLDRRQDLMSAGEQLVREYLAGVRGRYTNDPLKLAEMLYEVAEVRYRDGKYPEAETLYREIVTLRCQRLDTDDKKVIDANASLARLLSDWAWAERTNTSAGTAPCLRAREAEGLLRAVLTARLAMNTNSWRIAEVQSRLGAALVSVAFTDPALDADGRNATLTEAEALLLQGHEGLGGPSIDTKYQRDAAERLVRLYEAWNQPGKHSEWQKKLEAVEDTDFGQPEDQDRTP